MRVSPVLFAVAFALPAASFAQSTTSPAPGASPAPTSSPSMTPSPSTMPSPSATSTPAGGDATSEPAMPEPERAAYEDGLRDGRAAAANASAFGGKMPPPGANATPDYTRGYDKGFHDVVRHRRTNTIVVGGFVVVILALGAVAYAQSQSGKSGTIDPAGPALFRF